jgi:polyisoprenoid-binding protein YceI
MRSTCLVLLLVACNAAGAATRWIADASRSRLEFTATQAGAQFDGGFRRFDPEIVFDPSDLPHSHFRVLVETASAETGDKDRDSTLRSADFFAVERWPKSEFLAASFTAREGGRYEANGSLTLRNVTKPVRLAFTFKPGADGRTAELAGETRIRRLDFGVGQGEWQDTKWVGDEVAIRFRLFLQRQPAGP